MQKCVEKWLDTWIGVIQKVHLLKTSKFWLTFLLLFVPFRFTCTTHSSYVCFSEFRYAYEFSNEKLGSEKRKKDYVFCKLNIKD